MVTGADETMQEALKEKIKLLQNELNQMREEKQALRQLIFDHMDKTITPDMSQHIVGFNAALKFILNNYWEK